MTWMQPIETMPANFSGACWVSNARGEPPELAWFDDDKFFVTDSIKGPDEDSEWFTHSWVKWWAPVVAPKYAPLESDGHVCPFCGSKDLSGLMGAFWVTLDEDGEVESDWHDQEGSSQLGEERLCQKCEQEFICG